MQSQDASLPFDVQGEHKQRLGSLTFQTLFVTCKNLLEILHKYGGDEGVMVKQNLPVIAASPEFLQFTKDLNDLRQLDMESLKEKEKLPFFLNAYNMKLMHSLILHGGWPSGLLRFQWSKKMLINIGGINFSLLELEHSFLRGLGSTPKWVASLMPKEPADSPRYKFVVDKLDPRANFGICYATASSQLFRLFSTGNFEEELNKATSEFLEQQLVVTHNNEVFLPKIFDWYSKDFGSTKEDAMRWTIDFLQKHSKNPSSYKKLRMIRRMQSISVKFSPFSWEFCCMLFPPHSSIQEDQAKRDSLCLSMERLELNVLDFRPEVYCIRGPPKDESEQIYTTIASALSVSTYPIRKNGVRDGDPLADQYILAQSTDRIILALADGCGWGHNSRDAARKAVDSFHQYMLDTQHKLFNSRQVGYHLLRAFRASHLKIIEGLTEDSMHEAGTTTMIGGVAMKLLPDNRASPSTSARGKKEDPWLFVCASLGDCKAYHVSAKTKKISEITYGNRQNVSNGSDPGGRLGPYLDECSADLRNLHLYVQPCVEGDIVFAVSDGVHDSLDPEGVGKLPKDLGIHTDVNSWQSLEKDPQLYKKAEKKKMQWITDQMSKIITSGNTPLEPSTITQKLTSHCHALTQSSRDFMRDHPHQKLPHDMLKYPGKLDHTTCVAFKVGAIQT